MAGMESKALHQQPHLIVDAEIQGAYQAGFAALSQPGRGRLKQGRGHLPVGDGLKEPEETGFRAVTGVVEPVDVGRQAAHRPAVLGGQKIPGFADLKEGAPPGIQKLALLREQRGHPVRVALINLPGQAEKFPPGGVILNGKNPDLPA